MQTYKKTPEALAKLTPEQFYVTQESGTERPGTGALLHNKEPGIYVDIVSGEPLFASADKYESGCGWPSFTRAEGDIVERPDHSHGMVRTELLCGRCGGHLGHVFDDGPLPTGQRHCINGVSLAFEPESE